MGWFRRRSRRSRALLVTIAAAVAIAGITSGLLLTRGTPADGVAAATPTASSLPTAALSPTSPATPLPSPSPTPVPAATPSPTPATTATAPGCPSVPAGPPTQNISANFPTALAFAPDGRLFFADRGGSLWVVESNVPHLFARVATVTTQPGGGYSERGLLGLAISPTFSSDHYVYALYALTDYSHEDVVRWTDCGGTGVDMRTLIVLPTGSDCCHKGGRLAFGPDGELYVTLGDEHTASAAQNTGDVRGKILRYNPDGSVPADNPFGPGNPVWAYGLRNPFGLAFGPGGVLMVTSNGPSGELPGLPGTGYDLVLTVGRGGGYQWPLCYGYSHPFAYEGGTSGCGGQTGPVWSSETSTVVPTGATFVDAAGPSGYAGHFVFCTYDSGMLIYSPGQPHGSVTSGPGGCRLDVKEGPGGALYYSSTTEIYRLA
ncbi:MAG TPA: PQQ-dependent sugar dehydrogenase [Candidatus Binatia bacterium]|nr:PQQ-dependent sugar dehydrogenase [Candidatus Binatia bacterium]